MFILLTLKNLKIAVPMHKTIQIWLKPKQKTDSLWSSRVIVFKILVSCHFMRDYAPTALLGNLRFKRWIMQYMLLDAAGINLWSLITSTIHFPTQKTCENKNDTELDRATSNVLLYRRVGIWCTGEPCVLPVTPRRIAKRAKSALQEEEYRTQD